MKQSSAFVVLLACVLALAPSLALAAYNDVTLTTSAVISVGGYTLNVSGSTAAVQSLVVGATSFSVTLASGSSLTISSPARNQLSSDISSDITGDTCNSSSSFMSLLYSGTGTITNVITPSSTICTTTGGVSAPAPVSSGSTSVTPPPPVTASTPAPASGLSSAQVASILSLLSSFNADSAIIAKVKAALSGSKNTNADNASVTTLFERNLDIGASGEDVKALQVFLNSHGYIVASSGPGSFGNESRQFGSLTRSALVKYQKAKGITPAVGYFGPKTRASLAL